MQKTSKIIVALILGATVLILACSENEIDNGVISDL